MLNDITIHYDNELSCRLETDAGIAYELYEEFAFLVDGHRFMPAYTSGRWDGKIRLFDIRSRSFYVGLLPNLIKWCDDAGYTVGFADKTPFRPSIEFDQGLIDDICSRVKYEPRWYQKESVETALKLQKMLLLSPTSSGKSLIAYIIMRYLLEKLEGDILITVPSTSLVEQLLNDFRDYTTDGWDVDANCHGVYSGKAKDTEHRVYISTWQSVHKLDPIWFQRFDALICDEAHQADAKCISKVIDNMAHAPFRLGMTGTLKGSKIHELEMKARFGPLIQLVKTKDLQAEGAVSDLNIEAIRLKYCKDDIELTRHMDYKSELAFLVGHPGRNKLMAKIAMKQEGNTLMLFNYVNKHGKVLKEILEPMCKAQGKKLYFIHGATETEDRESIRQALEKESNCIILASFGVMSTGVSIKNLHTVMFCHPYKAVVKTLQSIGRVLRLHGSKKAATLIDFGDDLCYNTKKGVKENPVFKHFIQRLEIYASERFKYKVSNLNICGYD